MATKLNKFQMKAAEAKILGELYENAETRMSNLLEKYKNLGTQTQKKHWDSNIQDYVLEWEDEDQTEPKITDAWGYVTVTPEELEDAERAEYEAYKKILAALEKLL